MRDRKKLLSIILVFAMVLQMAFPTYADTRTVRRTLTKTTTTYSVTYVSYRTKDSNPVKTTKKITPTTPTAKPVPYQIANPTPTPEDDPILVSRINF